MQTLDLSNGYKLVYDYYDEDVYYAIHYMQTPNGLHIKFGYPTERDLSYILEEHMSFEGTVPANILKKIETMICWSFQDGVRLIAEKRENNRYVGRFFASRGV